MAKPAKYNRQQVIDKATNLYWKKGFHATSMRNLQDEIDMRPGSIYAAFGSKDGLFKEALRNYTDMGLAQLALHQKQQGSPTAALKAFVKSLVIDSQNNAPNGMCMLSKTISELNEDNQALIELTKKHLNEMTDAFTALIEQAQAQGEIDKTTPPQVIAEHVQIQIVGLRTFAKMNSDKTILNDKIEAMFQHYPF